MSYVLRLYPRRRTFALGPIAVPTQVSSHLVADRRSFCMRKLVALGVCTALVSLMAVEEGRTLVWADEFDTPGAPDATIWDYEVGRVRNKEAQYYTKDRRENARVEDGHLIIEARKEAFEGAEYTAASLHTKGKKPIQFGRIEVRAQIPTGRGMWPAIWTLGTNIKDVGWPKCGEIDILENVGFDPEGLHFNIHTKAFNHVTKTGKGKRISRPKPWEDFHVYAVEWTATDLTWFYDDEAVFTYANDGEGVDHWPFDAEQYLILNVAVGGGWGGQKGIDEAIFPQRMVVDYVRVYAPKK
jgi:beta-glucanase (GH16 family)